MVWLLIENYHPYLIDCWASPLITDLSKHLNFVDQCVDEWFVEREKTVSVINSDEINYVFASRGYENENWFPSIVNQYRFFKEKVCSSFDARFKMTNIQKVRLIHDIIILEILCSLIIFRNSRKVEVGKFYEFLPFKISNWAFSLLENIRISDSTFKLEVNFVMSKHIFSNYERYELFPVS